MDTRERISELLQGCIWVSEPAMVNQLLPTFAEDIPGFITLDGLRPDGLGSLPLACVSLVAGPLARVLATVGLRAARGDTIPRVEQLDDAALMADPLVAVCTDLLREAAVPGLRAHAAPALALAWAAPRMLRGGAAQVPGVEQEDERELDALVRLLAGMEPAARGEAFQRVGWELSGRLGAAVGAITRAGLPLPAAGLIRMLATNRLLLAFPRGTLDRDPSLEEVSGLLGADIDDRLAGAAIKAAGAAIQASTLRADAGRATGVDLALSAHLPPGHDPMRALMHPVAGPLLLGCLGSLVGVRELKGAGLDGRTAKALLKPEAQRALSAAWGDLAAPLRAWDLLSSLVDRVLPLWPRDGSWAPGPGLDTGRFPWSLLVPSGRSEQQAFVVAVRLTALRTAAEDSASAVRGIHAAGAVRQAWETFVEDAGVPVQQLVADHGLAAFTSADAAVRFAVRAAAVLSGPRVVHAGHARVRLALPERVRVSVGVSSGRLRGGTDGERTVLAGAAVARALSLAGAGDLYGIAADRSGLRRAVVGPFGLHSEGVVVDAAVSADMLSHLRATGAALHLDGETTSVGGLSENFTSIPVHGWWDAGDAGVVAFIGLAVAPEAPVELLPLERDDLLALYRTDAERARQDGVAPMQVGPVAPNDADVDPFAVQTATGPAAQRALGSLEPSSSFLGGRGAERSSGPSAVGEAAAHAILSGGEEFGFDEIDEPDGPRREGASGFADREDGGPDAWGSLEASSGRTASHIGRLAVFDEPESAEGEHAPSAPMLDEMPDARRSMTGMQALRDAGDAEEDDPPDASAPAGGPATRVTGGDGQATHDGGASLGEADAIVDPARTRDGDPFLEDDGLTGFYDEHGRGAPPVFIDSAPRFRGAPGATPNLTELEPSPSVLDFKEDNRANADDSIHETADGLVSGQGQALLEASNAVAFGIAGEADPPDSAMLAELVGTFGGYVLIEDEGEFTFGLRDGLLVRDALTYDTAGDEAAAYRHFVSAKVAEGFVPRPDRVAALLPGARARPLDEEQLMRAYEEVGE